MPNPKVWHLAITAYHPTDENNIAEIYTLTANHYVSVDVKDFRSVTDLWTEGDVSVHVHGYPCDIKIESNPDVGEVKISDIRIHREV
jgi:hypothetical protein